VTSHAFFGNKLKWAIQNQMEEDVFKRVDIPNFFEENTIQNSELFAGIEYQAICPGETFGIVKIVTDPSDLSYQSRDIVVCDSAPSNIIMSCCTSLQTRSRSEYGTKERISRLAIIFGEVNSLRRSSESLRHSCCD
jgi:hypothetical protein